MQMKAHGIKQGFGLRMESSSLYCLSLWMLNRQQMEEDEKVEAVPAALLLYHEAAL